MREMFEWQGPDIEEQFTFCIFAINFESKKFSLQTNFVRIFNNYGRLSFCLSFPLECFPAVFIILVDYHFAVSKFPNSKKLNLSFWLIIILVCTDCIMILLDQELNFKKNPIGKFYFFLVEKSF